MSTITSANSSVVFVVPGVSPVPQFIQGYKADDAFTQEGFDLGETRMGVDGELSGGYTPSVKRFTIELQADSPAVPFFQNWKAAIEAAKEQFPDGSSITVTLPSIGSAYLLNKLFFKNFNGLSSAKKLLEGFTAIIEYQDQVSSPL